mmetsp:Transcript_153943/g.279643  ORF Transcript_153943/g.279643 Transcript_153943/m.279643 type:complete len:631 (-) Transcript_153943:57-1949(-)
MHCKQFYGESFVFLLFLLTTTLFCSADALQAVAHSQQWLTTAGNLSSSVAWPAGDGFLMPNFFANSKPWTATDGERIHAHSGMAFYDASSETWRWIGNSDAEQTVGGAQNSQICMYSADELAGPWGSKTALLTLEQARQLDQVGKEISILERPRVHQQDGRYYLFLHIDDEQYRQRKVAIFQMNELAPPSEANQWITVFAGRPGMNKQRGNQGFEVADFNIYWDEDLRQLFYATTTDSHVWKHPYYCDTDVTHDACLSDLDHCQQCYNTAVVVFAVNVDQMSEGRLEADSFKPLATLPGRWEGIAMFKKPGDSTHLYMFCSGQEGFGSNPVNLFSAELNADGFNFQASLLEQSSYDWAAPAIFTCLGQPFSGSANAFNSQPTQILQNPYDPKHAIYIGDNWLQGPGKDSTSAECRPDGQPQKLSNCEPWSGTCPCGWPGNNCPGTSNPGSSAGYVWLSFSYKEVGETDYLMCADHQWNLKRPSKAGARCFTFNLLPDEKHTPGFKAKQDYAGLGSYVPFVRSSCGFVQCPGWPMTPEENEDPNCCKKLGDALTSPKFLGQCRRDDVCLGRCKDIENGNIPGGDGQCKYRPFDPSKASLMGGKVDCTQIRGDTEQYGEIVDSCRGALSFPH